MTLANLLNLRSEQDLAPFAFANNDHHQLCVAKINTSLGLNLTVYILDPIPSFDTLNWLRRHQQAHNDINSFIGTQGVDLTDVDFKNNEQLEAWSELHYNEHLQWQESLGVS